MFKYLMIVATAIFVSTPALADLNVNGEVTDTYKQIINKTPYSVEVCTDVNVPGDKTSDMLTGAIIGGILGHNNSTATGGTQRRCTVETRYNEEYQEVYSHSNITFTLDGKVYTVRFKKRS